MTMATQAPAQPGETPAQIMPVVPFRQGAIEQQDSLSDEIFVVGRRGVQQLVSSGYLEKLLLSAAFTIAETTAAGPSEDAPYNIASRLTLKDSAGNTVMTLTGYEAEQWSRLMGAHRAWLNQSADISVFEDGGMLNGNTERLTWELSAVTNERDSLGLLPNQSDAYKYTLEIQWASGTELYTTPGDVVITGAAKPFYRYYTVPQRVGLYGQPQENAPDSYGWVHQIIDTDEQMGTAPGTGVISNKRVNLPVGTIYRGLILIIRDGDLRANALESVEVTYGNNTVKWKATGQELRSEQFMKNGRDADRGVYLIDFASDSGLWVGDDYRRDYVDTRDMAQFWLNVSLSGLTPTNPATMAIVRDMLLGDGPLPIA